MRVFRRCASFVAVLVFLTSGPLGAWHVAREGATSPPCRPLSPGSTVGDAHGLESLPDGALCAACHLLQQVRGSAATAGVVGFGEGRKASHLAVDTVPAQIPGGDLLPARAPPAPARS